MPCCEVYLNGVLLSVAGGENTFALSIEINGGKEGPVSLMAHSLTNSNDHIFWVKKYIQSDDEVNINIVSDEEGSIKPPKLKSLSPKIINRNDLSYVVSINGNHECTAEMNSYEMIGAQINWNRESNCNFNILSGTSNGEGYKEHKEWLNKHLNFGDIVSVKIKEKK